MNMLLFGATGQVGWELVRALAPLGRVACLRRQDLGGDLARPDDVTSAILRLRPDVVVNAAAYTAVDRAEQEAEMARRINAEAPAAMARAVRELGGWLVHYSTDYVFDGSGSSPWRESDATGPLGVYGATKLEGELAVGASGCRALVLRTSWVFASRGNNFLRTMLRLAAERDRLAVVSDQFGAPTSAELIADVTAHVLAKAMRHPEVQGTYHLAAAGETNWHGYAAFLLQKARDAGHPLRVPAQDVRPVGTADYPTAARRPLNSRLDTTRLRDVFGLHLPDWRDGVERAVMELLGK
jgi:dTDP-4-dehydrorhamnose reductase